MQTIFLIRHGESEWNREGRVQGYQDSALSDLGVKQAHLIGKRLERESIDYAVSSTASRAADTCRIAVGKRVRIELSERIREINLGVWEGRRSSELRENYPEVMGLWYVAPSRVRIEGGETLRSFRRRVTLEMARIRREHENESIAVFTHGGVICAYLSGLLGLRLDDFWRFRIRNGSITKIIFPRGQPRIELLGDTHHLDSLERTDPRAEHHFFP